MCADFCLTAHTLCTNFLLTAHTVCAKILLTTHIVYGYLLDLIAATTQIHPIWSLIAPLLINWRELFSAYELMGHRRGCPPGRDFDLEDCREIHREGGPDWHWSGDNYMSGFLPKCFLYNDHSVWYNTGGHAPPKHRPSSQRAICKKATTPIATGESSMRHTWYDH